MLYIVFLFLVVVVLLNLLIAQMSDTYGSVQQDAQRSLAINRAWIVARVEHNSLLARVSPLRISIVIALNVSVILVIIILGFQKIFLQKL